MKEYDLGPNNEILDGFRGSDPESKPSQHDAFERRAVAQAAVCNQLERTGHSLEFHPAERVGLISGRIRRLIKKAFHIFSLGKESRKFYREFNVELHGTDDDRELMALYMQDVKSRAGGI